MIRGYKMLFREIQLLTFLILFITVPSDGHTATISMRLLYPSFAASWATTWIAKEAGYFATEGLEVELIRVGGSTRMAAAMLGGSAPMIQACASAALGAGAPAGGAVSLLPTRTA